MSLIVKNNTGEYILTPTNTPQTDATKITNTYECKRLLFDHFPGKLFLSPFLSQEWQRLEKENECRNGDCLLLKVTQIRLESLINVILGSFLQTSFH